MITSPDYRTRPPLSEAERHRAAQHMMQALDIIKDKSLNGTSLRRIEKWMRQIQIVLTSATRASERRPHIADVAVRP